MRLPGRSVFLVIAICAAPMWACSKNASAPEVERPKASHEVPLKEPERVAPLDADERAISAGLRRHAERLIQIGERNLDKSWELAEAADYLANALEELGYPVERQGYETGDVALQNLSVTISGGRFGGQIVVVGAHYDSAPQSRGIGTAMSTAAVLEIARLMRGARLERTLKLALFSTGESPHGDGEARGARHFARQLADLAAAGPPIGTPEPLKASYHVETVGLIHLADFSAFASAQVGSDVVVKLSTTVGGDHLARTLEPALFGAPLHIRPQAIPSPPQESDVAAFLERGIPVVSIHPPSESNMKPPGQYENLARIVMRLRRGVGELVGEMPTNDTMVTTPSGVLR